MSESEDENAFYYAEEDKVLFQQSETIFSEKNREVSPNINAFCDFIAILEQPQNIPQNTKL